MGSKRRIVEEHREVAGEQVTVRRSSQRRRTVQAYQDGSRIVVMLPLGLRGAEADVWIERMVARITRQRGGSAARAARSDEDLLRRAGELSAQFLDARATPAEVRWVRNQNTRWGSCTPATRSIRLSHRLQGMPGWVIDYVLLHELAHLLVPNHGAKFWALLAAYPRTERARGYLEGVLASSGQLAEDGDESDAYGADDVEPEPSESSGSSSGPSSLF